MSLNPSQPRLPSEKSFGLTVGLILLLLGSLQIFFNRGHGRAIFVAIGIALVLLAVVYPKALIYPNRAWFKLGILLSKIFSPVMIGILYFFILTPFSIALRILTKYDPLRLRMDPGAKSYWIERAPYGPNIENSRKQY